MKFLTSIMLVLMLLVSCLPAASSPTLAPENFGRQAFINVCQQGYWDGKKQLIQFRDIEGVNESSCQTYTLVNFQVAQAKSARVSGLNLEINSKCVTISSIVTDTNIYDRLRCSFDTSSNVLNLYLLGEDIVVITEIVVNGKPIYFPPIGVQ